MKYVFGIIVILSAVVCFCVVLQHKLQKQENTVVMLQKPYIIPIMQRNSSYVEHTKSVAVCVRGLVQPLTDVSEDIVSNIIEPLDADVFMAIALRDNDESVMHDLLRAYRNYRKGITGMHIRMHNITTVDWFVRQFLHDGGRIPTSAINAIDPLLGGKAAGLRMYWDIQTCEDLIVKHEKQRGMSYDWVVITRVDLRWFVKGPSLHDLISGSVYIPCHKTPYGDCTFDWLGGYTDSHFIMPRKDANALFGIWRSLTSKDANSLFNQLEKHDNSERLFKKAFMTAGSHIRRYIPAFIKACHRRSKDATSWTKKMTCYDCIFRNISYLCRDRMHIPLAALEHAFVSW
jgi:hypothetical protein